MVLLNIPRLKHNTCFPFFTNETRYIKKKLTLTWTNHQREMESETVKFFRIYISPPLKLLKLRLVATFFLYARSLASLFS